MSLDAKAMSDLENEDEVRSTAFEEFIKANLELQEQLKKTQESSNKLLESLSKLAE